MGLLLGSLALVLGVRLLHLAVDHLLGVLAVVALLAALLLLIIVVTLGAVSAATSAAMATSAAATSSPLVEVLLTRRLFLLLVGVGRCLGLTLSVVVALGATFVLVALVLGAIVLLAGLLGLTMRLLNLLLLVGSSTVLSRGHRLLSLISNRAVGAIGRLATQHTRVDLRVNDMLLVLSLGLGAREHLRATAAKLNASLLLNLVQVVYLVSVVISALVIELLAAFGVTTLVVSVVSMVAVLLLVALLPAAGLLLRFLLFALLHHCVIGSCLLVGILHEHAL